MTNYWTISEIWNKSTEQKEEKPMVARNRIWASELGRADVDIYLKLMGELPSNPFDARAKRKFEAGNLFEWIVKLILKRCGIYKESQRWIGYKMDENSLEVSGKLDHLAGGIPKYEEARKEIRSLDLPELFVRATDNILDYFQKEYPDGLPERGIEVKSVVSFGIEKVYFTHKAMMGHDLQTFHYAYNTKIPFTLLYICRDDLRMAEIPIEPDDKDLLARYQNKIRTISEYYNKKEQPKNESPIVFDNDTQRFTKNFNVEYSGYLTKLYGFATPKDFDEKYGSIVESWNRVITRIKEGKPLTDNNKEKLDQIAEFGLDITNLIPNQNVELKSTSETSRDIAETPIGQ